LSLERHADFWLLKCRCGETLEHHGIESPLGRATSVGWEIGRNAETEAYEWQCPECARAAMHPAPKPSIASIPNERAQTGPAVPKRKKEKFRSPPKDWKRPVYSRDWTRK
jgi:hypothetical protein